MKTFVFLTSREFMARYQIGAMKSIKEIIINSDFKFISLDKWKGGSVNKYFQEKNILFMELPHKFFPNNLIYSSKVGLFIWIINFPIILKFLVNIFSNIADETILVIDQRWGLIDLTVASVAHFYGAKIIFYQHGYSTLPFSKKSLIKYKKKKIKHYLLNLYMKIISIFLSFWKLKLNLKSVVFFKTIVFSKAYKKYINDFCSTQESIVLGNLAFVDLNKEKKFQQRFDKANPKILLCTSGLYRYKKKSLWQSCNRKYEKILKSLKVFSSVDVRLKPAEELFKKRISNYVSDFNFVDNTIEFYKQSFKYDLIVCSKYSTIIFECIILNIPFITYDHDGLYNDIDELVKSINVPSIENISRKDKFEDLLSYYNNWQQTKKNDIEYLIGDLGISDYDNFSKILVN